MVFAPSASWNSHSITHLANYPSRSLPMNSSDESYKQAHPRIASTLNELGKIAQKQGKFDEAETDFRREADIYRKVYDGKHYYIGVALSNQAGVYVDKKQYDRAEPIFREALQMYSETLPANHQLVAIAQVRLGDALAHQRRY